MTDWADEAAKNFDGYTAGRVELLNDIASALRAAELRGRVKGMRETVALLEKCGNGECLYHVEEIEAAADKLESSPTT